MVALFINPSPTVKLLGVTLGQGKMFNQFITRKILSCNYHIRNLKTIRHCLPKKKLIFNSYIIPKLDYCNSLLLCSSNCDILSLQRSMNRAVRYVFNLAPRDRVSSSLFELHVLPVFYRIRFKACLIAYKIIYPMAPKYLQDNFSSYDSQHQFNLRESTGRDTLMFQVNLQEEKGGSLSAKLKKRIELSSPQNP